MMMRPELMAPAGSMEALVAAVANGADAVYLGGKSFSARASAANFDRDEMREAIEHAHLRGAKIYVTVNTILDNGELAEALDYLHFLYTSGADAVIVQDLGLIKLARQVLPELPLYASTQMTVHNAEGVRFLTNLGVERVVLAREVSLEAIRQIHRETKAELEVFVHGALCISYSGQCLMSSMIGGRSGNRGRCAQPCRMTYGLVDGQGRPLTDEKIGPHLLSPRDLNLIHHLPELIEAGVSSFKIEGRMKRPEYVATVVRVYRQALDRWLDNREDWRPTQQDERDLYQIFNREFTTGYLMANPGRNLMSYQRPNNRGIFLGRVTGLDKGWVQLRLEEELGVGDGIEVWVTQGGRSGVVIQEIQVNGRSVERAKPGQEVSLKLEGKIKKGDRVFKTNDARLMDAAQTSYAQGGSRISITIRAEAAVGRPLALTARDPQGNEAAAQTDFVGEPAQKHPLTETTLAKQLERLGNTPYVLAGLDAVIEGAVMVPVSEINEARRRLVADLSARRQAACRRPALTAPVFADRLAAIRLDSRSEPKKLGRKPLLSVAVGSGASARAAIMAGADLVYLSGEEFRSQERMTDRTLQETIGLGRQEGCGVIISLPRIWDVSERPNLLKRIEKINQWQPAGLLAPTLGSLQLAVEQSPVPIYADYPMNVYNDWAVRLLQELGAVQIALSPELNFAQLEKFGIGPVECLVHGSLTMMVSEHCVVGALLGNRADDKPCSRPCLRSGERYYLRDRMNFKFPLEMDQFCRMHIHNPKVMCLIEHLAEFQRLRVKAVRIEARREDPDRADRIVRIYRQALDGLPDRWDEQDLIQAKEELTALHPAGLTKAHYFRGVL